MIEVKVYAGAALLSQVFDIEDPETAVFAAQRVHLLSSTDSAAR